MAIDSEKIERLKEIAASMGESEEPIETLKTLGVMPPEDRLLERIERSMERRQFLCD